jgi:N-methylhydantoinase A
MVRAAFDIGGTFTDFVLQGSDGVGTLTLKVPTSQADPAEAVLAGFQRLLDDAGVAASVVDGVLHGTTVATNAIIERKGASTALITTRGFRDILLIGRQKRYETYDLYMNKPAPLVRRRDIFEVDERMAFDGAVLHPLDDAALDAVVESIVSGGYEAVAVALLHAYANPAHERKIRERLAARAPSVLISLSSDVSPKFREYERTSTTVANSYIKPVVTRYIGHLQEALAARGFRNDLFIMQSNGGLVSPDFAREYPIRIVESGPAAGVLMCGDVAAEEGADHVITFDMGGTTAKLGAIDDGALAIMPSFEVDPIHYKAGSGLPISLPAVELLEIGAGGGSIAHTEMGIIQVGPESAGADPGPVCYGQGGERPTVTDANLVLGYLNPDYFNGGAMRLDRDAAEAGIVRAIGGPLTLDAGAAAWGIHTVANSNMERAMRIVSLERGRDPRRYAMVAFGGAGPLHATRLARALGIPQVIVPHGAGVGSAFGLLQAEPRIDVSLTRVLALDTNAPEAIAEIFAELELQAGADLKRLGMAGTPRWSRFAYMRYAGQGYEVRTDLPDGAIDGEYASRAAEKFHETYERQYRYRDPDAAIEAVDWYLVASLPASRDAGGTGFEERPEGARAPARRQAYFPETDGFTDVEVLDRAGLRIGEKIEGPALIEEADSTTIILPGDRAAISPRGHLVINIGGNSDG